jgi:pimeloyl-ACP methyl ester carboxylesterase
VDAETIDDAVAAVAPRAHAPGRGPGGVFVVGHSLGGMLAPEIAARDGRAAGVVLLAREDGRSPRPRASRPSTSRDAPAPPAADRTIRRAAGAVGRPRRAARRARRRGARPPASYWYDLDDRRPLERARGSGPDARGVRRPRLPGTAPDVAAWRAALDGRAGAAVEVRPALNHLLVPGEGPSSPEEYQTRPGHVERELVERIARWVLAQPPAR